MVDATVIAIVKMGHGGYRNLFYQSMRPIISLWLSGTYRRSDYTGWMNKNRWHSVDAHSQDQVGSMSLEFLQIKAANTSITYNHHQLNFQLPNLHDLQLLTLHWRSFCHGCIYNKQSFDLVQCIIQIVLAAFLAFSFTFSLITTLFFNNTYEYIL